MDKRNFLKYGLAAVIGLGTMSYAAPSEQQARGESPRGQRGSSLENSQGLREMPAEMRKKMEERRQKAQELGRELESLKEYKFPDADKNREYHQKVEKILEDYKALQQRPPMPGMQGRGEQGKEGNREGLQRPERLQRPGKSGSSERPAKQTIPPLEEKTE